MRRFAALTLVIALLSPTAALAHGDHNDWIYGAPPGSGRAFILQQPVISTQEWNELRREAHERRMQFYRESGAYAEPAATAEEGPTSGKLRTPKAGKPSTVKWGGTVAFAPDSLLFTPEDGNAPCQAQECEEFTLTVPKGAGALYVKTAWDRPDYGIYLYAFSPSGEQYGEDFSDAGTTLDKHPGNSTTLPLSELSVKNPEAGDWRIRVRAAWGIDVDYRALATVTKEKLIQWDRQDPYELSKWAVATIPVNIVFSGYQPTEQELSAIKENLPTKYRISVKTWSFAGGGPGDSETNPEDNCIPLSNWSRCHYAGTYEKGRAGELPYFEPVKFKYDYHFLQADETFTKAAFAKMEELTEPAQPYHAEEQTAYLTLYNNTQGRFRAPDKQVVDTTTTDMIDALAFEDWLFESRFQFCKNFTDLETGKKHGGGFIAPDPKARLDPYFDTVRGLDTQPQGRNEGETVFFFDTYTPEYAADYFDMSKYHNFSTMENFLDPDTEVWDGIDYGRLWGGRYRFAFYDMAAAPNFQESTAWPNGSGGGSADPPRGDPPIWEYQNNPLWAGKFEYNLARNVYAMLFSRMTSGFLYRPIPHDIYQMTTTNFDDYYARPPYGIWWVDLPKIYDEKIASKWLSAAIPNATFRDGTQIPGDFEPYLYPGCSDEHVGSKNANTGTVVMAPDPTCVGEEPDPLQQTIELAKAQGDDVVGAGIPFEQAVSSSVVRNFWERNRDQYAPLQEGVHSFINVNAVFEKSYTWSLPAIVGGIAYGTPHNESWGQLQNRNDRVIPVSAINCEKSAPGAPGCNGVLPVPTHETAGGLTYVVGHEASHSLGLLHPHDWLGVDRDANGKWNYYYDTLAWMPDSTNSPTTYFGSIAPYGIWDQENLNRGHSGEYIKMAQDAIAHAYFEAGRRGIPSLKKAAPGVLAREERMFDYLKAGKELTAKGDFLHAEYAYKNAYLAASGVTGAEQPAHRLEPGEKVLFEIEKQAGPTRAQALDTCKKGGGGPGPGPGDGPGNGPGDDDGNGPGDGDGAPDERSPTDVAGSGDSLPFTGIELAALLVVAGALVMLGAVIRSIGSARRARGS